MRTIVVLLLFAGWPMTTLALSVDQIYQMQIDAYNRAKSKDERLSTLKPSPVTADPKPDAQSENPETKHTQVQKQTKTTDGQAQKNALPESTKYSHYSTQPAARDVAHDNMKRRDDSQADQYDNSAPVVMDRVSLGPRVYGIPLGSTIKGVIKRNFSSAEPGLIGIFTTEPVQGKHRVLPAGTEFFAETIVNPATKRIELQVVKGITPAPESYEFAIRGKVRDSDNVSGIAGIVNVNTDNIVEHGVNSGLIAAGKSAIGTIANTSVVGSAVGAGADTMLNDSNNVIEQKAQPNITIYASAQNVIIGVERSF